MAKTLDGLIVFFASHHAIRAEKMLREAGMSVELIPGPKDISPNCGVALRFEHAHREAALAILDSRGVRIDEVHMYRPATDEWQGPKRGTQKTRSFRRKASS